MTIFSFKLLALVALTLVMIWKFRLWLWVMRLAERNETIRFAVKTYYRVCLAGLAVATIGWLLWSIFK